jgi:ribose/xylose/arabinose/galactoside ABC-type transport system permease subunit
MEHNKPKIFSFANFARDHAISLVLLTLFIFMFVTKSQFGTLGNILNVLQQNAVIGILACGMTFAIILGGFDLSVGAITALSSVVGATIMIELGSSYGIPLGIAVALGVCVLVGMVNGFLVAYLRINPFVVTLGMMTIIRGLIFVATNATPRFGVDYSFTEVGLGSLLGLPIPTIIFSIIALILGFTLHQTRFGHYVFAVGGNINASSEMGVNTVKVGFWVYILTAFCAGCAGIILIAQTASAQPQAALGYELTSIAAVIVGGAALGGGRGKMWGTIVGVFILGIVSNGLNLYGVSPFWQPVATGLILIMAVGLDRESLT